MKKIIIISIAFVAIGLVGAGCVPQKTNNAEMQKNTAQEAENVSANNENIKAGSYEEYNEQKLSFAKDKDVVIFFHASWCPTCRALENDIKKNTIPENLVILKLDYDSAKELRKKYSVTTQHTLVQVDENGNQITKWTGGNRLSNIVSKIK